MWRQALSACSAVRVLFDRAATGRPTTQVPAGRPRPAPRGTASLADETPPTIPCRIPPGARIAIRLSGRKALCLVEPGGGQGRRFLSQMSFSPLGQKFNNFSPCPCLPLGVKLPTCCRQLCASPFVEFACLTAKKWEIPTMEIVTKLDGRRRGIFPSPFQPGDSVVREYQDSNRVTFRLLKPAEVPVVKSLRKKGYTILKAPAVSRAAIAEALRAERDAR